MYDLIDAQRKIAPEALSLIERRYLVLKEIRSSKIAGRRMLANKLDLTERTIRNDIEFLKDEHLIDVNPMGMTITDIGIEILDTLTSYIIQITGLSSMQKLLASQLGIKQVFIAPTSCKKSSHALEDLGRVASKYFLDQVQEDGIIGLTGGYTLKFFAEQMSEKNYPDLYIVPARGGVGEILEIQSNTIVAELANKLKAHYKLLQIPDNIDKDIMESIFTDPGIKSTYEYIKKMDMLVFGIGNVESLAERRHMDAKEISQLKEKGAVAESFGHYFDINGKIVHETSTVGISLAEYAKMENILAIAGGENKAEAILSISKINKNLVLVIDEDAAKKIVEILNMNILEGKND